VIGMGRTGVEYASDQITVYRFCPFNCRYCWAWRLKLYSRRIKKGKYNPIVEARKYLRSRSRRIIVVSFTSDPYPPIERENKLTRRVLEVLSKAKQHRIYILTKNPGLALRDVDLMLEHGDMWLGTTLTSVRWNEYEPNAPEPLERMDALKTAKSMGVPTWISIEPIIPGVTYPQMIVLLTMDYVDYYVLGALSYAKNLLGFEKSELRKWYRVHVNKAIELLNASSKRFYVKNNLDPYLRGDK